MKQRQPMGGGFFLLVLALTMLVVMWMRSPNNPLTAPAMTEQDVYVALENGTITKARIRPDAENSTGKLQLWLKSGDMEEVHVLNVSDFAEEFRDDGIPYEVEEIPKENYALTIMLPILLSAGLLAAFFMFMNLRNAGGGNAKMMNFGRSQVPGDCYLYLDGKARCIADVL